MGSPALGSPAWPDPPHPIQNVVVFTVQCSLLLLEGQAPCRMSPQSTPLSPVLVTEGLKWASGAGGGATGAWGRFVLGAQSWAKGARARGTPLSPALDPFPPGRRPGQGSYTLQQDTCLVVQRAHFHRPLLPPPHTTQFTLLQLGAFQHIHRATRPSPRILERLRLLPKSPVPISSHPHPPVPPRPPAAALRLPTSDSGSCS